MRFEQLKALREIAKTGSITAAAENLYVTQQAVSRSIKQLEEELGITLIIRTKNGAVLTKAGAEAMMVANHILDAHDYLQHSLKNNAEYQYPVEKTACSVCSNSPFLTALIPMVFARTGHTLWKDEPVDEAQTVLEHILNGSEKLGLITVGQQRWEELLEQFASAREQLHVEVLDRDRLVCVKSKRHYTWDQNYIPWTEFCLRQKTFYNLSIRIDGIISDGFLQVPQELALHYSLLEHSGVLDLMPERVYQRHFGSRRFMAVMVEEVPVTQKMYQPLYHLAICRSEYKAELEQILVMLRREVHKQ